MLDGLGELPAGWAWARLGEIIEAGSSCSPAREFAGQPTFAYVDLSAIKQHQITSPQQISPSAAPSRARQKIQSGDTLFSCVRVYLENIAQVSADLDGQIASTAFAVLRPVAGVDRDFVYWLARSPAFIGQMIAAQRGNSPPAVQEADVRNAWVPVPPLAQQARIAAAIKDQFTELGEAEAALARARASLAEYRASLLHAACTGQLTAAWRASHPNPAEDGPALLRRILAERRAAWERAELARLATWGKPMPVGEAWKTRYKEPLALNAENLSSLPIGWVWVSIEQATYDILIGLDRGAPQQRANPPGMLYIKMGDINSEGHLDMRSAVYVEVSEIEQAHFALRGGDLLLNTRNSLELVGKTGIMPANHQDAVFNNNLMRLRVTPLVCPDFLHAQMNAPGFKLALTGVKRATTNVAAIYAKDLMPLAVAIPPKIEQEEIAGTLLAAMANIREQADCITEACRQLATLRQSILHAAFTGRLVPQDPADEPAAVLLARLRDAPAAPRRTRKQDRAA